MISDWYNFSKINKQIFISLIIFVMLSMGVRNSYSEINQNDQEEIGPLINLLVVANKTSLTPTEIIKVTLIVNNQSPKRIFNIKIEYIDYYGIISTEFMH